MKCENKDCTSGMEATTQVAGLIPWGSAKKVVILNVCPLCHAMLGPKHRGPYSMSYTVKEK